MAGLLDFLQSASNTAASNVSAPVDGIAWLLRKAGIPIPDAPIGGSDWMQQKGLTRPVQQSGASLAGETVGLLAPMVAAAKAPQIAGGLLQMGENAMAPRTLNPETGAIVWHGSPHKFDKFDSSKIGTGEGAQAYGHGLYLAESPDVAKSYQSALSADRGFSFGGKTGLTRAEVQDMVNAKYGAGYLDGVIRPSGVADSFIDDMVTGTGRAQGAYPRQYKPGSQRAKVYDELRGQIVHADPGQLYKVDLPDEHIAKMLDYDKLLKEQIHVINPFIDAQKASLESMPSSFGPTVIPREVAADIVKNKTGSQAYDMLRQKYGPEKAAEMLRQSGIPGIRYLDGGSRGAGAGTSNYVVFPGNEDLLTILERNGQGLLGP